MSEPVYLNIDTGFISKNECGTRCVSIQSGAIEDVFAQSLRGVLAIVPRDLYVLVKDIPAEFSFLEDFVATYRGGEICFTAMLFAQMQIYFPRKIVAFSNDGTLTDAEFERWSGWVQRSMTEPYSTVTILDFISALHRVLGVSFQQLEPQFTRFIAFNARVFLLENMIEHVERWTHISLCFLGQWKDVSTVINHILTRLLQRNNVLSRLSIFVDDNMKQSTIDLVAQLLRMPRCSLQTLCLGCLHTNISVGVAPRRVSITELAGALETNKSLRRLALSGFLWIQHTYRYLADALTDGKNSTLSALILKNHPSPPEQALVQTLVRLIRDARGLRRFALPLFTSDYRREDFNALIAAKEKSRLLSLAMQPRANPGDRPYSATATPQSAEVDALNKRLEMGADFREAAMRKPLLAICLGLFSTENGASLLPPYVLLEVFGYLFADNLTACNVDAADVEKILHKTCIARICSLVDSCKRLLRARAQKRAGGGKKWKR